MIDYVSDVYGYESAPPELQAAYNAFSKEVETLNEAELESVVVQSINDVIKWGGGTAAGLTATAGGLAISRWSNSGSSSDSRNSSIACSTYFWWYCRYRVFAI